MKTKSMHKSARRNEFKLYICEAKLKRREGKKRRGELLDRVRRKALVAGAVNANKSTARTRSGSTVRERD